jgi:hypothetical protein
MTIKKVMILLFETPPHPGSGSKSDLTDSDAKVSQNNIR